VKTLRATVAIIGAGASGGAVAWRLASAGIDVLCLEQGDRLDQARSPALGHDWERALQTRFHPDPNIRRGAADYPVTAVDTPIQPALFNGVGGGLLRHRISASAASTASPTTGRSPMTISSPGTISTTP
jgi:choline dehydrogenase-like flavoprotein